LTIEDLKLAEDKLQHEILLLILPLFQKEKIELLFHQKSNHKIWPFTLSAKMFVLFRGQILEETFTSELTCNQKETFKTEISKKEKKIEIQNICAHSCGQI
jgi:hypothetical protein